MMTAAATLTTTVDFETIYASARGDAGLIPWEDGRPSTALVNWLNAVAPSLVRCGARVAVVGCGLGHDARELVNRGYDVTAFDCSESAIRWARRLDAAHASCYVQGDLFQPPGRWRHRFDLVVEVDTLEYLAPEQRLGAASALADMLTPHGRLLVIGRGEPSGAADDPPAPMSTDELVEAMALAGLVPERAVASFDDDRTPPVRRTRGVFVRA